MGSTILPVTVAPSLEACGTEMRLVTPSWFLIELVILLALLKLLTWHQFKSSPILVVPMKLLIQLPMQIPNRRTWIGGIMVSIITVPVPRHRLVTLHVLLWRNRNGCLVFLSWVLTTLLQERSLMRQALPLVCQPSPLKATDKPLGTSRSVIVLEVYVRTVVQVMEAVS